MRLTMMAAALGLAVLAAAGASRAEELKVDVYNPGKTSLFPVSSEIISGRSEAVLVDAQFGRREAQALAARIKATGKKLTTIYISHSDPDFYFGLETITAAFPGVKVVATPQTVAAIQATKALKLAYWGPILKDDGPKTVIAPQPLSGDTLTVDGEPLKVLGLDSPSPERTVLWIPSPRAVVGGVLVFANAHVWVADTQTLQSRRNWIAALDRILALEPELVVPGHFLPDADGSQPFTADAVRFTRDYLEAFDEDAARAPDAAALIAAMKARYPGLADEPSLEMSAKVIKGEMKWP